MILQGIGSYRSKLGSVREVSKSRRMRYWIVSAYLPATIFDVQAWQCLNLYRGRWRSCVGSPQEQEQRALSPSSSIGLMTMPLAISRGQSTRHLELTFARPTMSSLMFLATRSWTMRGQATKFESTHSINQSRMKFRRNHICSINMLQTPLGVIVFGSTL